MYQIHTSRNLSGRVNIGGSKNAALPLIAASLLIDNEVILTNVPDIHDVHDFIHFLESIGSSVYFKNNTLTINNSGLNARSIDTSKIARTRAGIYFVSGLLKHFKKAKLPFPHGDNIGKRPINEHTDGYREMGYKVEESEEGLEFFPSNNLKEITLNAYFAVSATANLIMGAVIRNGITHIELSAFEPHIFNLVDFLRNAGVRIDIRYDHTITIYGGSILHGSVKQEVISDYLQSGTFAIIGALCAKDFIDIYNARIEDLSAFLYKLHKTGVKTENLGNDTLRVHRCHDLKAVDIQTNIFPGFPTDLMPLFSVLMTQCEGTSRIHEILYEGRLNWLIEYERLGCSPRIINLHEAKIEGPANLVGNTVNSWDLRSGAAMVIAGLVAEGETIIDNVYWIGRGYDKLIGNLQSLGASIQEINN